MWVTAAICKAGQAIYKCRLQEREDRYGCELPAWMFDEARCAAMRLVDGPRVNWQALQELRLVLSETIENLVVQHRQLLEQGDADEATTTAADCTTQFVRTPASKPAMGNAVGRNSPSRGAAPGASAVRTPPSAKRRRRRVGGGR